jgi:flagellar hook assembly protein FlgD
VTVTGQYTVTISVYNEAGEVVKTISIQQFSQPVNSAALSSKTITTLKGPGGSVQIFYQGHLIGTWDGTNDSNLPVTNGAYEIKIDSVGTTGVHTSVDQQVVVSRSLANVTINIYNGAGEVIRKLYGLLDDSSGTQMTDVSLSTNVIKPGSASSSTLSSSVQILVMTSSGPVTLTWDGTSDAGKNVTSGEYQIEVHWDDGQGATNITRGILVMSAAGADGIVIARPNVLGNSGGTITTFDATGVLNAYTIKVSVYTMAGELMKVIQGPTGTAMANWDADGSASGLYIAVAKVDNANGGTITVQRVKILVLH